MNELIFQLHSPEEFRYLSSLGHWIAGYIFLGWFVSIGFFNTATTSESKSTALIR